FFFSSRRRHTSFSRDWSSDVCSSDLSTYFTIAGQDQYITASIGVSVYPDDGEDLDTLVKYADIAMYMSKDKGGNTVQFFDESMKIGRASCRERVKISVVVVVNTRINN